MLDVTDGTARVRVGAACAGCPATILHVVAGMEQELRRLVPGVEFVELVP